MLLQAKSGWWWVVAGWEKKRILLVLCHLSSVIWLSACGFHPMYAQRPKDATASQIFAGVQVDSIPGRAGQLLKTHLEDKLNPDGAIPPKPAYRLNVVLKNSVVPIGVARDGTVSRYNVYLSSQYVLYRNADGKAVTSGDVGYVDSYNNLVNQYYSTYISEEDAFKNGIVQLSEQYRERLGAYLSAGAPQQEVTTPSPMEASPSIPLNPLIYNPNTPFQTPYQ